VESVPGQLGGAGSFKGTRMPVQTVFDNIEAGMSVREITGVFDVRQLLNAAIEEETRRELNFLLLKERLLATTGRRMG